MIDHLVDDPVDVDAPPAARPANRATDAGTAGVDVPPALRTDTLAGVPSLPLRPQLAPHAAVGVLVLAAAAARAAMHLSDADATIALSVAGTAFVVAVVAAVVAGVRLTDRHSRHRAVAFCTVAASWLSGVVVMGLSLNAVAILATLGYGLSLHWWRQRRIGAPTTEPAPATTPQGYAARWWRYLGGRGGEWAGSRLESPEPIKTGVVRYVLRLVPGKHTYTKVMTNLELIRGVLGLTPEQDVIVERHPLLAAPNLLVTIVTASPVKADQTWPGPNAFDPHTGRVALGPFVDGEGIAFWKAYTNNRLFGGYLCGITGTGKSRMIESIALSLAASHTHPTVIMYGDGQGGASSPLLRKYADLAATTYHEIHAMLAGLLLVGKLRQDENDVYELEGFTPTVDRPGIVAIIDECHKPLSKAENPLLAAVTQLAASTITREFGKVGIALILASQQSTLDAFGGAGNLADALRNNLLAGNGVLMRCKSANAKQVFRVDVDPTQFPEMPGYAFLVDPEEGARSAPFRGYYVKDDQRTYWPERIAWRPLDDGAANTFGPAYLRRHERAAEARRRKLDSINARRAGLAVATSPDTATGMDGAAIDAAVAAAQSAGRPVGGDGAQAVDAGQFVAQFPVWDPTTMRTVPPHDPAHGPARTPAGQAGAPALTDRHRQLVDALRTGAALVDGYTRPQLVADTLGCSVKWAGILLGDLVAAGMLRKGDVQGRYYPTGRTPNGYAA